jgi:hypothetical protein
VKFFGIILAWLLPLMMITASGASPTYRLIRVVLLFGAFRVSQKWFGPGAAQEEYRGIMCETNAKRLQKQWAVKLTPVR